MSTPYPPQQRRLMRDPSRKMIGGVCSGLAKYLNMDVNLVRLLTVLIALFTGVPIVLYLIALFVMPEERPETQPPYVHGPQPGTQAGFGGQPTAYGAPAQPAADPVWGAGGAPWESPQPAPSSTAPSSPASSSSAQQTWPQQPSTSYDTAPATPVVDDPVTDPPPASADDPSADDASVSPAADDELTSDTKPIELPAEETSTWESAPADPSSDDNPTDKKD